MVDGSRSDTSVGCFFYVKDLRGTYSVCLFVKVISRFTTSLVTGGLESIKKERVQCTSSGVESRVPRYTEE